MVACFICSDEIRGYKCPMKREMFKHYGRDFVRDAVSCSLCRETFVRKTIAHRRETNAEEASGFLSVKTCDYVDCKIRLNKPTLVEHPEMVPPKWYIHAKYACPKHNQKLTRSMSSIKSYIANEEDKAFALTRERAFAKAKNNKYKRLLLKYKALKKENMKLKAELVEKPGL